VDILDRPASTPSPVAPAGGGGSGSTSFAGRPEFVYFREIARLGAQVADALDYAHRQNVVHRDIKPSNLLLDPQGNVWVTDFGLAKLVEGDDLSQSQDLVGTLRFMAPERFRGVTDRRGDIYALGATLYEMLALRPAFAERDQILLIDQIVHQAPAPLRQHDRRIPRDLETIVHKVLAKDPKDRCDKAGELRDELRRFLDGRPTRWRRVGLVEQFRRWCKRNPVVAGLNAVAATLTIIIAIVSTVAAVRLKAQQWETAKNLVQANRNLIQAYGSEAEARRMSHRVGQRFVALGAIERAMRLDSVVGITEAERFRLRNEAIAAMALPDLRVAKELGVPRAKENGFAVDPAFERYAFKRDDGTVIVRRLSDDAELFRLPGLPPARDATQAGFSPDGRYLAMTSGGRDILQVWDLQERRLVLTDREMTAHNVNNWSFRHDGRELALGRTDDSIVFYELPSGRLLRRWTEYPYHHGGALAYSPDGAKLAIRDMNINAIKVVASDSSRLLTTLSHLTQTNHFVWNPRRPNLLAVACEDNVIYIWDVETGKQTMALKGETSNGIVIAYHPRGELLASRGWHNVLRLWDTRTSRMVLSQPSNWSSTLEFDRTGRWLNVDATQERARILEVADAAECRTLVREPFREDDRHHALAIEPAGRRAVTTGSAVTVWDLPTGATLATLPVSGINEQHQVLFEASGAVLTEKPALLRWPVTKASDGGATIGPPQILQSRGTGDGFAITPDGRMIAAAMQDDGGLVFDAQSPQHAHWLRPHRDVRFIAISADGSWVVTGSMGSRDGMKLWDTQSGRLVHDFPSVPKEVRGVRSFSPDGRWLAVWWDGCVLLETTTWTPQVRLSRSVSVSMTFAPDSRTAVFGDHAGTLILAEVETGREVARFEDPEQGRLDAVAFTPDGLRLVTTLLEGPYIRVWDLRAIRRRLAELRLDWDPPATFDTPDAPGSFPSIPKPFRVDRGQLDSWITEEDAQTVERTTREIETNPDDAEAHHRRGHALYRLKRYDEAIADFTAALKASPNDAHLLASRGSAAASLNRLDEATADCEAALRLNPHGDDRESLARLCNTLAWTLATGPASTRDPARALNLAWQAVELTPDQASSLKTLGVAQYRMGQYAAAVATLEKSIADGKGESDAFDLFFLAMARYRLGQIARARADFDRAVSWRRDHPNPIQTGWTEDLDAFQAEARALLDGRPPELPADVFAPGTPGRP
jgi:WD40 repeat protein/Flp pilus assembly protein TadD